MTDNMNRVGIIAEVATAAAAVTYPIVRVFSAHLERRRNRNAKRLTAAAAAIEARLAERFAGLEARIVRVEKNLDLDRAA